MMGFSNVEARYRFARFSVFGQQLGLMIVPFVDVGGVWNRQSTLSVDNIRISEGAGFRVAWNQSTIVSFDYGVSEEDHQLFVALGHAF
jgi:hemolysin activation/secretion protein